MKSTSKLDNIQTAYIDPEGTFKYIQIKLNYLEESKIVVRGWKELEYHKQNLVKFRQLEDLKNVDSEAIGGGRIKIDPKSKSIFVYGYSQSYGLCDHSLTCELLKTQYPDYSYSWSNDGY